MNTIFRKYATLAGSAVSKFWNIFTGPTDVQVIFELCDHLRCLQVFSSKQNYIYQALSHSVDFKAHQEPWNSLSKTVLGTHCSKIFATKKHMERYAVKCEAYLIKYVRNVVWSPVKSWPGIKGNAFICFDFILASSIIVDSHQTFQSRDCEWESPYLPYQDSHGCPRVRPATTG